MEINVKGAIISNDEKWIYEWFDMDACCPNDVIDALKEREGDEEVLVKINSPGGNVFAASEIFAALKEVDATAYVVGLAASAASIIAMACNEIYMVETGLMMIHNASSRASGDYRTMDHCKQMLETVNKSIIMAYKKRTGKSDEELQQLMDEETWMNVEDASALGFCDGIYEPEKPKEDEPVTNQPIVAPAASFAAKMIPVEVVDKMQSYRQGVQLKLNELKEGRK